MTDLDDLDKVLDVIDESGVATRIDAWLKTRPGVKSTMPTHVVLLALILAAGMGGGFAGRLHRATRILLLLDHNTWRRLGMPRDVRRGKKLANLTAHQKNRERRLFYRRFWRKWHAITEWMVLPHEETGWTNERWMMRALLNASLPEHVREYDSLAIDAGPTKASFAEIARDDLDPDVHDVTWRVREYTGGVDSKSVKRVLGYQNTTVLRIDPTSDDPTAWIGAISIDTGSAPEIDVALDLLDVIATDTPVLDLVVADRGYTRSARFHDKVHSLHGDVVMDLTEFQHTSEQMAGGALNINGAAYSPATPEHLRNPRRRTISEPLQAWLEEHERLYGLYRLPHHTLPDVHGQLRLSCPALRNRLDCDQRDQQGKDDLLPVFAPVSAKARKVCTRPAITVTRDDYVIVRPANKKGQPERRIHTYQPLAYGTFEWAMVYAPWRSRLEGSIGTLSEHHGLWGGRHGFKVRGRPKVALLAICAAVAFNLTRQGHFLPDHGTQDCSDDTQLDPPPAKVKSLRRILRQRRQTRDALRRDGCDCPAPTSPSTTHDSDPPTTR